MNISVIIPDHNDLRIENLIKSIDYFNDENKTVELLIILNKPTNELIELVEKIEKEMKEKFQIKKITINYCNLGLAYNTGIKNASFDNILFLDSDLICGIGSIEKMVQTMIKKNVSLVKGKLIYKKKNTFFSNLVYKSRLVTTTNAEPPYIPVILIKKGIFNELNDGYMFPVDTVWCSDADFAYRVLAKKIPICYNDAIFYHTYIGMKKDLHDAFLYGLGKGIRMRRKKENWNPLKEILYIRKLGIHEKLSFIELLYLVFWSSLMQLACLIQQFVPNTTFFKESLCFKEDHE